MQDAGVAQDGSCADPAVVETAAAAIGDGEVVPLAGRPDDAAGCREAVDFTLTRFGRIDGLIHNAGLVIWADMTEVDQPGYETMTGVSVAAPFWLVQAALPHMRAAGFGRIVLTTSNWALHPHEGAERLTLYCLGKGAQFGLAMALANSAGHRDICVNALSPVAKTRIYTAQAAPGRLRPDAVAGTVTWLMSPGCGLTGRLLKVADGRSSLAAVAELAGTDLGEDAADPDKCGAALKRLTEGLPG